jgi:hypothetical protein
VKWRMRTTCFCCWMRKMMGLLCVCVWTLLEGEVHGCLTFDGRFGRDARGFFLRIFGFVNGHKTSFYGCVDCHKTGFIFRT